MAKKKKPRSTTKSKSKQITRWQPGPPSVKMSRKLIADIRILIDRSRQAVAQTVNTALVWLYWNIGQRIRDDLLEQQRAEYGEQILQTLSAKLVAEYGKGFGWRNMFNMVRFAELFPDRKIVQALSGQLSWSHFVELIHLDDSLQRDFYAEMCRAERWSVRTLRDKMQGMLFERTALSKKSGQTRPAGIGETARRRSDVSRPRLS